MRISELADAIMAVNGKLEKAKGEILGKIQELEEALGNVEVPEEVVSLVAELGVAAQALDDVVPDLELEPEPDM